MPKALGGGAVAAIALSLGAAPADAARVKLTFETFIGDDPACAVGVFGEREMPFFSNGSFQIVFDPSKSIAPTSDGLRQSSMSITYGVGEFIYGGFGDHIYKTEALNLPTFYSYNAANNFLHFGSTFVSADPGAGCRYLGGIQEGHCGVMVGLQFAEGSYFGGLASWHTNPGPYAIFQHSSYTVEAIPEPSTWAMLVAGFASLGMRLRRRRSMSRSLVRSV